MTKHIHYEAITAWANGQEIEVRHSPNYEWHPTDGTYWFLSSEYRVKQAPKPDIVHGTSIILSHFAGPRMYDVSPSEANCVLVFDGETGKLKECIFKGA